MSVQIVINGETANEAIQELAALSAGITGRSGSAESTSAPASDIPKTERVTRAARAKSEPAKTSPVAPPEPEDDTGVSDVPETDDSVAGDEPIPTDVELREIARSVGARGPEAKAAIKELLNKYGVSNITAVPNEKRILFKRELEALA